MSNNKIEELIRRFNKEKKEIFGNFDVTNFPKKMDSDDIYAYAGFPLDIEECQKAVFNWYKLFESGKSGFQLGKSIVKGLFSKHFEDQFHSKNFNNYIDSIDINIDRCFENFDPNSDEKFIHDSKYFGKRIKNKSVPVDEEIVDDGEHSGIRTREEDYIDFMQKDSIRISIIIKNMSNDDFQNKIEHSDDQLKIVDEIAELLHVPSDNIHLGIFQRDNSKKFRDLKNKKVDSLEKILKQIGRLSNHRLYEYSSEDFNELKKEIIQKVENNVFDPFAKALKDDQESSTKFKLKFDDEEKLPF
tara:strand:- start:1314 stop:2216 length:903 start_codon:yes stop_codon:yes gene_type:complete